MKKFGNLYEKICNRENLLLADLHASKGKSRQKDVKFHIQNREANLELLHQMLVNKTFKTSEYKTFTIFEPKKRIISRLPYFPDRPVQHAIMNVVGPIWLSVFTKDTYSCIKGRGVHLALKNVKLALKDVPNTTYCLKLDIQKFYPSVDHKILKRIIRLKIKDNDVLDLIDGIIDSSPGLPIGNYLSQFLGNLYLTYFDHWLKEVMRVKYYFRYCDDMVILSGSKQYLHQLLADIRLYLDIDLNLALKPNYQIFPVESRGIDFLGYVIRHDYVRMRKRIKQSFARAIAKRKPKFSLEAYKGWAKHANTLHLIKKLNDDSNKKLQRFRDNRRIQRDGRRENRYIPGP
ncbi:hypothetical protein DYBT9275_02739 [Dyadobacter sp. CECT 9275]|uniref:Reverse transcriptase domain-containing protein n=1 Tax=Dyadobacter helix TaxID=2822344 RepID=A0A916JC60_9BACT|nr:reverse transcriptase/maturase family protein [Dyadobacter sp. CECT 9275]CAG5001774.1 hypothetical protein DYBT9275_02739 [Dyadobacter sp. CECT 9275]